MLSASLRLPQLAICGLISALLVTVVAVGYLSRDLPQDAIDPQRLAAADFNFVMGSGRADGEVVVTEGFADGYALLSSGPVEIDADAYRFLTATVKASAGAEAQTIFWRRSEAPDTLIRLQVRKAGTSVFDMSTVNGWTGRISELGFLLREPQTGSVAVGAVLLEPDSLTRRLQSTWHAWTTFERWTQKSVNFLHGGTPNQPLRLPVLAGAWIGLTLALLWLATRFSGRSAYQPLLVGGAVLFMIAWMILDLRWTANQFQQAQRTLEPSRGATEEQRLAGGLDGEVYRYIQQLKRQVLPKEPARVLILGDGQAVEYLLQRAKYHLLPHSAYATRQIQFGLTPDTLDYVMFFGAPGGIEGIPGWSGEWQTTLVKKHRNDWSEVYEVVREGQ